MKFALHFANLTFPDPAAAHRVARPAEASGFETLITVEHVVRPTRYETHYPYAPDGRLPGEPTPRLPDPLIWMAHAAAVTTTLRLKTGVMIVPQRDPLVLPKQVATLDHLAGGRIDLGIGVGWLREESTRLACRSRAAVRARTSPSRRRARCGPGGRELPGRAREVRAA